MTQSTYTQRRKTLTKLLKAAYIISGYEAVQLSADMEVKFIQEANFLYLTGIEEAGWQLVVDATGHSTLIAPQVSDIHRTFDGGLSLDEAKQISGVESTIFANESDEVMKVVFTRSDTVATIGPDPHADHYSFTLNAAPIALYEKVKSLAKEVTDMRPTLAKMRGLKTAEEVDTIQAAVDLTIKAFTHAKKLLADKALTHEYSLQAEFSYMFEKNGASHAYDPIVASGSHACTLHYGKNSDALPKNGLVLLDIGAKVQGYCADITRTYAIGTPSDREVAVHAAVERAHHEIIALLKPGLSVKDYYENVDTIMKRELDGLGLLKNEDDYRTYFPHSIGHGLGIDVHDPLGMPKVFEAGMVLTVEPGIYIPEEGIGVRIEDDILITKTGHKNLSAALPTSL